MKKILIILILAAAAAGVFYFTVYEKEGAMEGFGRQMDETLDRVQHGDESTMEKASRKLKESAEDYQKK